MKFDYTTQQNKSQKGFTIIETLVAIAILMVAIAGPLTVANKSLNAAIYAHDQVTASYLAQDAMEYVKNVRDDNLLAIPVNSFVLGLSGCTSTNPCSVDTLTGSPSAQSGISHCNPSQASGAGSCLLYNNSSGYTPNSAANPTPSPSQYTRYFYLAGSPKNSGEYNAIVMVSWVNGQIPNAVTLEDDLFNVLR